MGADRSRDSLTSAKEIADNGCTYNLHRIFVQTAKHHYSSLDDEITEHEHAEDVLDRDAFNTYAAKIYPNVMSPWPLLALLYAEITYILPWL